MVSNRSCTGTLHVVLNFCLLVSFLSYSASSKDETIHLPTGIEMKPCDNQIVRSIPGNFSSVLEVGRRYVALLMNDTVSLESFSGKWKWEPDRFIHEPLRVFDMNDKMIYECSTMKVFGDEKHNYDEAKRYFLTFETDSMHIYHETVMNKIYSIKTLYCRFCFFGDQLLAPVDANANARAAPCTAYSIGSNNKWNFEEDFFRSTNCAMETFDCTCNVTIPPEIVTRQVKPYNVYSMRNQYAGILLFFFVALL